MASNLCFPSIYLLPAHLTQGAIRQLETQIPTLTKDASKAEIFLGKLSREERAQFELRRLGIHTAEKENGSATLKTSSEPPAKRKRVGERASSPVVVSSASSSATEDGESPKELKQRKKHAPRATLAASAPTATVKVVKLSWFTDSLARGKVLPLSDYIIYETQKTPPTVRPSTQSIPSATPRKDTVSRDEGILKRAQADLQEAPRGAPSSRWQSGSASRRQPRQQFTDDSTRRRTFNTPTMQPPPLVRTTTSEHDKAQLLPPIPAFLHTTYSCQRPSPAHPPNEAFIDVLKKIRVARQLTADKIGVRAYSTAIASLVAYPYKLTAPAEVGRLPGCGPKIAELFREFQNNGGHVREADDDEADPRLAVLRLFYNIWGVAEATARSFYNKGWRELDDVVEHGWTELTRVQQIGVKYYEELQEPLTRPQVQAIADKVLAHANRLRPGYQMVIVGGYRRGKELSGDVDIVISHPDEAATHLLIGRLVLSLEQAGLVTHTLILSTANSDRGQEAVSWKGNTAKHNYAAGATGGAGFDTLDKALVVWQEPADVTENDDTAGAAGAEPSKSNRNPHRRVDIIISPWKTVGCAVLGWSSGTTFQRDLRRYCKYERGLRFDSSGVRSRTDGSWVDLEDYEKDPAPDMLTAERRVFAALELEWRPPEERCTG